MLFLLLPSMTFGQETKTADALPSLVKLPYNHADRLIVNLQVGLWAQPLPMDWDGDGDLDMVAATSGGPSNGVWVYENVTGPNAGARGERQAASTQASADRLNLGQSNTNTRGVSSGQEKISEDSGDSR